MSLVTICCLHNKTLFSDCLPAHVAAVQAHKTRINCLFVEVAGSAGCARQ